MSFVGPLDPDLPPWAVDLRGTLPAPRRRRNPDDIDRIANHRAGGGSWPTKAEELIGALGPAWREALGDSACPYWGLIEPSGRLVVVHGFDVKGSHSGTWNTRALGLAWIGDFRKKAPTAIQRLVGLQTNQWFMERFEKGVSACVGHDELKGGSVHAAKRCPGDLLDMDAFREDLAAGRGVVTP